MHRQYAPEILKFRNTIMALLKHKTTVVLCRSDIYQYNLHFSEIYFDIWNIYPKCLNFSHSCRILNFPIQQKKKRSLLQFDIAATKAPKF